MTEIIPVSRRLIFRGVFGLGAAALAPKVFAAPAIIQPRRLPPRWEGLALGLECASPRNGREVVELAFSAGLDLDYLSNIMLQGSRAEEGCDWPRLTFEQGPNHRGGVAVMPGEVWGLRS